MPHGFQIDPADAAPIWRQIEEQVRLFVATGALPPATPVPSVRDLAKTLQVNPATVAKAYQRLVDAGVLMVKRGEGTYVAETPPAMEQAEKARILREGATRYAVVAKNIGVNREEAITEIRTVWERLSFGPEGAAE